MATTVESVDNLPKPPPQDRVNPTEGSSAEHQRRQFKKTLKEEMERDEGERKPEDHQRADTVTIGQDREDGEQRDPGDSQTDQPEHGEKEAEGNKEEEAPPEEHIDLKA